MQCVAVSDSLLNSRQALTQDGIISAHAAMTAVRPWSPNVAGVEQDI